MPVTHGDHINLNAKEVPSCPRVRIRKCLRHCLSITPGCSMCLTGMGALVMGEIVGIELLGHNPKEEMLPMCHKGHPHLLLSKPSCTWTCVWTCRGIFGRGREGPCTSWAWEGSWDWPPHPNPPALAIYGPLQICVGDSAGTDSRSGCVHSDGWCTIGQRGKKIPFVWGAAHPPPNLHWRWHRPVGLPVLVQFRSELPDF